VFQGIRRTPRLGADSENAAITAEVRAMVETLSPTSLIGMRDRALLLVGFAGAFGRSELVALDVADIVLSSDGLVVQVRRRSKTDQEDLRRKIGLPFDSNPLTCPVRSLRAWLDGAAIDRGPIFRPGRSPWQRGRHQADRSVGRPDRETLRQGGRGRLATIRRPFAAIGIGHRCGHGRRLGTRDHGSDRAQVPAAGQAIYTRRESVSPQRRGCRRFVSQAVRDLL
jgi:integrase